MLLEIGSWVGVEMKVGWVSWSAYILLASFARPTITRALEGNFGLEKELWIKMCKQNETRQQLANFVRIRKPRSEC